jgi:excisionase family DNA binding protein
MTASKEGDDRMLRVTEASKYLGITAQTLRKWTDQGIVQAARLPGRGDRRYPVAELRRVRREVMGLEE